MDTDYIVFNEDSFTKRIRNGRGKFIEGERWQFIYDGDWDADIKYMMHVSDYGRVIWNLSYLYNANKFIEHYKGYVQVTVGNKVLYLHRLVAFYFVENPNPIVNKYVNHKDFNKKNNHFTNLEWVTAKMNSQHYFTNKKRKAES
ncbi:HNH endonuclease [Bacillus sp. S/N-304-OC-R1]|uniref:HNH endonuclease n=1 Tax=Bacillus sp. S/N-304-OC-R1 TaxID=2758034 RepID=UPI001C8EDEE5|nr:HNH endonuclease [Bacillus sp. S/N-304-OC-R1]MBY0123614.1 HNH endonuclease [Bacillus sp. S/N-304-OC-R1]